MYANERSRAETNGQPHWIELAIAPPRSKRRKHNHHTRSRGEGNNEKLIMNTELARIGESLRLRRVDAALECGRMWGAAGGLARIPAQDAT